jgi:hypothetical protein
MNLFDNFTMDGVRRTSDGYLAAFARVARTGIQVYKGAELGRPDLDTVRVFRPADEVFSADALKSFAHRPVTLKHPSVPVTARNWKKFAGGQTGDEVVRDGEFVRVPMVMMDQALIDAYEKQGVKELSMGYSTDIKWTAGVTDAGEPYDAVQTSIRGNHLAVVPVARGGDQLRIGDADTKKCPECGATVSADADECPECGYEFQDDDNINDGEYPMKLVIDGLTVNVADDQSGGIIERHIASLMGQIKTITDSFDDFKKKKKEDDQAVEDAKKLVDAKDGEIAVLKKQVADAAITPEKLDVLVKDRLAVVDKAKAMLDSKYAFDGKTVEVIRKDAVTAKLGDSVVKHMNDAAIEGAFAALTVDSKTVTATTQIGDALRHRPHGAAIVADARDEAFTAMENRLQNAWKGGAAN